MRAEEDRLFGTSAGPNADRRPDTRRIDDRHRLGASSSWLAGISIFLVRNARWRARRRRRGIAAATTTSILEATVSTKRTPPIFGEANNVDPSVFAYIVSHESALSPLVNIMGLSPARLEELRGDIFRRNWPYSPRGRVAGAAGHPRMPHRYRPNPSSNIKGTDKQLSGWIFGEALYGLHQIHRSPKMDRLISAISQPDAVEGRAGQ